MFSFAKWEFPSFLLTLSPSPAFFYRVVNTLGSPRTFLVSARKAQQSRKPPCLWQTPLSLTSDITKFGAGAAATETKQMFAL